MKTLKFIPSAVSAEGATLTGHLILKVPNLSEKLDIEAVRGSSLDGDGNVTTEKIPVVKILKDVLKLVQPFFIEVQITKADKTEHKSYDDLSDDPDCHGILIEVATKYMSGFKVGNV
jgi:hypothetical protein